jgi:hypothetical protein
LRACATLLLLITYSMVYPSSCSCIYADYMALAWQHRRPHFLRSKRAQISLYARGVIDTIQHHYKKCCYNVGELRLNWKLHHVPHAHKITHSLGAKRCNCRAQIASHFVHIHISAVHFIASEKKSLLAARQSLIISSVHVCQRL